MPWNADDFWQRKALALGMRMEGASYRDIAAVLGYSPGGATVLTKQAMRYRRLQGLGARNRLHREMRTACRK